MLADHAWNGTDEKNKRHNADLRRRWWNEVDKSAEAVERDAWKGLGLESDPAHVVVFNTNSVPRACLVSVEIPTQWGDVCVRDGDRVVPCQIGLRDAAVTPLGLLTPIVPGYGFKELEIVRTPQPDVPDAKLIVTPDSLESPYYRLRIDRKTGGVSSLVHKPTGRELVVPRKGRTLGQTVFFDGEEHTLKDVQSEVGHRGPVCARLRTEGTVGNIKVATDYTLFAERDLVSVALLIRKPVSTKEQRLCHVFPVVREGATVRVATPGAVVRPQRQPVGDLLPGADVRRMAVQEFVDVLG